MLRMAMDRQEEDGREAGMSLGADYLVTGLSRDGRFRVIAARTTILCEEGRRRHGTSRTVAAALGRALTSAALVAATLDESQSTTLRFMGDGPVGGLIVDGRRQEGYIAVRGYPSDPSVELPFNDAGKLDVGKAVGKNGFLYVIKDLGLKEPYTGSAALRSGEIGLDLANYYAVSEQLPTAVSIGVRVGGTPRRGNAKPGWVSGAGGLMVQVMPEGSHASKEDFVTQVNRIQTNLDEMGSISLLIQDGAAPEELATSAMGGVDRVDLLSRVPVRYQCRCSMERAIATLVTLGKEDLAKLAAEQKQTEVRCHFCNEVYVFTNDELKAIAAGSAAGETRE